MQPEGLGRAPRDMGELFAKSFDFTPSDKISLHNEQQL